MPSITCRRRKKLVEVLANSNKARRHKCTKYVASTASTKTTGIHYSISMRTSRGGSSTAIVYCKVSKSVLTACISVAHVGQARHTNLSAQREKKPKIKKEIPSHNRYKQSPKRNSPAQLLSCALTRRDPGAQPGSTTQLSQWRPAGSWWFLDRCTDRGLLDSFMGAASQI